MGIKSLSKVLTDGQYSTDKEVLLCYGYDASGIDITPAAVVWPQTTTDIVKITRFAYENNYKLIPRGAGTGMTGGSVPMANAILMSLEKMNRIIELDVENLNVVVEPGVINGLLQIELEDKGYFYPPDPASLNICSIGGNVAENAGGPRAVKYGVTRDYVMQLEAVLPDGRVINTGVKTAKGVVGYDITRLLVGSEGTLATISKIRLKVLPKPDSIITLLSAFASVEDSGRAVAKIIASGIIPRTLELMDKLTLFAVNRLKQVGFPEDIDALLLIEVDGNRRTVAKEADVISNICNEFGGKIKVAVESQSRDFLWDARRSVSAALYKISPTKINEDVVVPINRVPALLMGIEKLSEKHDLPIACFGHAGDGNIHVNIMTDKSEQDVFNKAEKVVRQLFELTLSLGGTLSGEHGIGLTKAKYIDMELDMINIDLMKGIKNLFDPKNILNPGKIFPPE
ncbi:MAG: FAD-linked oxidase C-terminal domain-containing protein [Candidatus Magnetobacterium sp. LHC-1]|uniref:FAD-binding protein n=1 Tax=Candidatus Magnetobacterium casense TaxID=1455061 RepID=A0ABS6S2W9_9BACT|nr:FAD-linked oxidase C-terminal domain-containing protein [Candidatus Magnetobacterium casensis]MBF0606590.1 FAD-binding protein [Nitrospirota bacterium]MBV6343186.1 FAD-binding protein [Candidatus Magnetobacterium casensis]